MTAPIDIECPYCKSTAGNYCTSETTKPDVRQRVTFYHAERIDNAFRANTKRQHDPRALREALGEALTRMTKRNLDEEDLSFVVTTREVFGL